MIKLLEDNFKEVIDNMDNILFVGGGGALLFKYMESVRSVVEKYYKGDFIVIPELAEF
jgi:exopolysaccharide biosynthesis predicted pyruvyltransferase EpsI